MKTVFESLFTTKQIVRLKYPNGWVGWLNDKMSDDDDGKLTRFSTMDGRYIRGVIAYRANMPERHEAWRWWNSSPHKQRLVAPGLGPDQPEAPGKRQESSDHVVDVRASKHFPALCVAHPHEATACRTLIYSCVTIAADWDLDNPGSSRVCSGIQLAFRGGPDRDGVAGVRS